MEPLSLVVFRTQMHVALTNLIQLDLLLAGVGLSDLWMSLSSLIILHLCDSSGFGENAFSDTHVLKNVHFTVDYIC